MLALLTCSPWSYIFVVAQLYSFGAEPYDNVFDIKTWQISSRMWKRGETMHYYWLISSLIVHYWFLLGAAWLNMGIYRPSGFLLAILGFKFSHLARVAAYDYYDRLASWLEIMGLLSLTMCFTMVIINKEAVGIAIWFGVAIAERYTHLPAAFKYNANWMRSYDLWLNVVQTDEKMSDRENSMQKHSEVPTPEGSAIINLHIDSPEN